jgi:CheY-like chemotaxis protein
MSLLNHVRANYPDIPVIIISGMDPENVQHLAQSEGVIGYFPKPFKADELGRQILDALQEEAKSGIMHNVSPTMFMQLMEMEGKTCTIRMIDNHSGEGGIIYLLDGQLLDARVADKSAMDAAYHVFSWEEVTVFFRNECEPRENRINSELQSIIMGALAAKDELDDSSFGDEEGSPVSGGSGDDLGLPPELLGSSQDIDLDEEFSGAGPEGGNSGWQKDLRELLQAELGEQSGVDAIYSDERMNPAAQLLDRLGKQAGYGSLKAGYVEYAAGRKKIVIPGAPPTILEVDSAFPVEKILKTLQKR